MKLNGVDVERVAAQTKPVEVEVDEQNGNERTFKRIVEKRIKTLKELVAACEIDTDEWEIYRWKCGVWQTGMKPPAINLGGKWKRLSDHPIYSQQFVVQAWMKRKVNVIAAKNEIESLRKKAAHYIAPRYSHPSKSALFHEPLLAEFSLLDHHFGALIWGKETGGADYDSKIAKECYEDALTHLIAGVKDYKPERALIVFGSDQQNIDNRIGATEKGTRQDSDSRYQKVFETSRDVSIWAVDALTTLAARVDVCIVSGNHDYLASWHLGDSLAAWYRLHPNVHINNEPTHRKYVEYGNVLLMFTHGGSKLETYAQVMAAENPIAWGRTQWREVHTGDKHHFETLETKGAIVRILPSLRPPDAWSSENNYIGNIRAAEAFVWDYNRGLVGTSVYSILGTGNE